MPDIIASTLRQVTILVNEDRRRGGPLAADGFYARVQNLILEAFDGADVIQPEVARAGQGLSFLWRDGRRSITLELQGPDRYSLTETDGTGGTVSIAEGKGRPSPERLRSRVVELTEDIRAVESARAATAARRFNRDAIIRALDEALWDRGNDVRSWPADEAAAYREHRFTEGAATDRAIVIRKAADAVLAAIGKQKLES